MKISPVIRLTLDPETRRIANIHERAVGVAFMHPMEIHEGVDMSQLTVAEQAALKNGAFAMFSFYAFNSNLCTQNFCPLKLPSWYLPYPLQKGTCLMIFLFPKSVGYERSFPKNQIFE